ncbi:sigma-54-dependent Fis family transcriptional regulator [Chitinophaga silvatica]|uniref:Sigma-54-dependent Fis family transcriptional regulator n=1 Tax=Chitinophaga silvatica TaxID=2282649 RepID=A0A3E1YCR4_9BACT|nr:sigma-54 dependent transcriptional regulator [Chitinophaga silvatica]RFS24036.1 sigma-54-dependent Fis family transcriptional regulator [Chitinophaga silvatica]
MSKGQLLIIDDEEQLRKLLGRLLALEGYSIFEAGNIRSALKILEKEDIHVVLSDVKLPDGNGVALVEQIRSKYPATEIIVLTAYGNITDGVQAIKNGAFDYITKGDDNNRILPLVSKAMEQAGLRFRIKELEQQISGKYSFKTILGETPEIKAAISLAEKVAPSDLSVLLLGETGAGKEVFAQSIHQGSQRKQFPFVAVNCSAFGKEILESELFGHVPGAFTGAVKEKKGFFEEAKGGTIFLDEIGEMALELQAKLLRVLETQEFYKVGEARPTKTNVRIIAATNRNLETEIANGHFRADLFYRLAAFQINIPSLNERRKDIPLLATWFLKQITPKINKRINDMTPAFIQALQQHNWKGNIRELRNVIERAAILTDADVLDIGALPLDFQQGSEQASSSLSLADIEKQHIVKVLTLVKGNKTKAAEVLGIGLTTLYNKLKEYQLQSS